MVGMVAVLTDSVINRRLGRRYENLRPHSFGGDLHTLVLLMAIMLLYQSELVQTSQCLVTLLSSLITCCTGLCSQSRDSTYKRIKFFMWKQPPRHVDI